MEYLEGRVLFGVSANQTAICKREATISTTRRTIRQSWLDLMTLPDSWEITQTNWQHNQHDSARREAWWFLRNASRPNRQLRATVLKL